MTCRALVYHKGWPDKCSRAAVVRGYCAQHAKVYPAPRPAWYVELRRVSDSLPCQCGSGHLPPCCRRCANEFVGDAADGIVLKSCTFPCLHAPDDVDDWEGPPAPEYSEVDLEAYDEMVRDDLRGAW